MNSARSSASGQSLRVRLSLGLAAAALIGFVGSSFAASITPVNEASIAVVGQRWAQPDAYSTFRADLGALRQELANAPLVRSNDQRSTPVIDLPMPDGSMESFRVYEAPVMAAELQAKYPEIRTYEVSGLGDRGAWGRISVTPLGLHGLIFKQGGTVWIDPFQANDTANLSVCWGRDYHRAASLGTTEIPPCQTFEDPLQVEEINQRVRTAEAQGGLTTGDELRTYRLACAATGEYTAFHGGTVPLGMAAIVVAINRVVGVYIIEYSVSMELVANNNLVVYTNGATDPYTNNNGGTMLGQNQSNLNAVIGNANYDIGHVFSTGGGGIASLGCVCVSARKAQGVTGLNAPIGDNFYIDYVAHEMGHQFGATHSFNSVSGSCSGGNRTASTAYEIGSGTTIMAYAGICGGDNIQQHSDAYMHNVSFGQIRTYTETGAGNGCAVTTLTGDTPPTVDANIGGNFTIPLNTPFEISGSADDADLDPLTYCWEEYDLGPAGTWNNPSGNAPIFRSFLPVTGNSRVLPRIQDVINNTTTRGEIKPTYARNLQFRLTVRDGRGGVAYDAAQLIAVAANGPFVVTSPNTTGIIWNGGSSQNVTWDVAGTNVAPVSCANVDIFLSLDGGFTYPEVLATNVPNDGSESVVVPNTATTLARVKVKGAGNIFFDISNANFEITSNSSDAPEAAPIVSNQMIQRIQPNPTGGIAHVFFRLPEAAPVRLQVFSASGRVIATLADGTLEAGDHSRSWDGTDEDQRPVPAGVYFYRLEAGTRVETQQVVRIN